ncbi:hypothetical protein QVA66_08115 [Staphylococcus chromogenes]|nr:hypothetical protein [Staphylococcus chromogenes]
MLRLVSDNPKAHRPKKGQIYLLHTDVGFIPCGIGTHKVFWGERSIVHLYRALISDPADTSYYPLIDSDTLLLPPMIFGKTSFGKGGYFHRVQGRNLPKARGRDFYYGYAFANNWNLATQSFGVNDGPIPSDRPATFLPETNLRMDEYDFSSGRELIKSVERAPEGSDLISANPQMDLHLEFTLHDALVLAGLLPGPRPSHPDFSRVPAKEEAESQAPNRPPLTMLRMLGRWTLTCDLGELSPESSRRVGEEGNGYELEALVEEKWPELATHVKFDSEAELFTARGSKRVVSQLHDALKEHLEIA